MNITDWRLAVYTLLVCTIAGMVAVNSRKFMPSWMAGLIVGVLSLSTVLAITALFCSC